MSMFGDRYKRNTEDAEGDPMLPFMSLLLIIIPILITNISFYHLRSVNVTTPGESSADEEQVQTAEELPASTKVMLQLNINRGSVNLDLINESSGEVVENFKSKLSKTVATELREKVLKFRHKFDYLETMLVNIEKTVRYEDMVIILDECQRDDEELKAQRSPTAVGSDNKKSRTKQFMLVILPKEVDSEA